MSLGCAGSCECGGAGRGMAGCGPCVAMLAGPVLRRRPTLRGLADDPLAIAAAGIQGKDPSDLERRTFVGASTGQSYQWYGCPT